MHHFVQVGYHKGEWVDKDLASIYSHLTLVRIVLSNADLSLL